MSCRVGSCLVWILWNSHLEADSNPNPSPNFPTLTPTQRLGVTSIFPPSSRERTTERLSITTGVALSLSLCCPCVCHNFAFVFVIVLLSCRVVSSFVLSCFVLSHLILWCTSDVLLTFLKTVVEKFLALVMYPKLLFHFGANEIICVRSLFQPSKPLPERWSYFAFVFGPNPNEGRTSASRCTPRAACRESCLLWWFGMWQKARRYKARHGMARQGKAKQEQDKTRQDNKTQHHTNTRTWFLPCSRFRIPGASSKAHCQYNIWIDAVYPMELEFGFWLGWC